MTRESILAQAQVLMGEMKRAASAADYSRVVELNGQQKTLLQEWAKAREGDTLTLRERTYLSDMQTDMHTLTTVCEKARDQTVQEGKALAINRDAAELYRQSASLKG